jgi:hypothetical protein
MWWIERFSILPGQHYRYVLVGWNAFNDSTFYWSVPSLQGPYVFRLREVR